VPTAYYSSFFASEELDSPIIDTMVTRVVIRRISSGKGAAAANDDSDRDDVNRLKDNKQSDEETQKLCSFKTCQSKSADGRICDGPSSYHDVFFNDDTATDDGKAVDIQRDSSTTRKRPLMTDDVDDTEEKKRRKKGQKSIDLTDVPPKLPILKSIGMGATSKYRGVYFHKATNKWRAGIMIHGKRHHIGSYANEEQAAVDYARAMFKYGVEQRQNAIDLTDVPPSQPPILNDSSTRKRSLITDDADGTEQKGLNQLLDWTTHVSQRQNTSSRHSRK